MNYSAKDMRRLDLKFNIEYTEDVNKVTEIIKKVLENYF